MDELVHMLADDALIIECARAAGLPGLKRIEDVRFFRDDGPYCSFEVSIYGSKRPAIQVLCSEKGPLDKLTVHLPKEYLRHGEICVPLGQSTGDVRSKLLKRIDRLHLFDRTGSILKGIGPGQRDVEIWRWKNPTDKQLAGLAATFDRVVKVRKALIVTKALIAQKDS